MTTLHRKVYDIHITGSGDVQQLELALRSLARFIMKKAMENPEDPAIEGEIEDPILCTTIHEI